MDKKPFVSIIIPVYNASQYLDQCLTAIITNSYSSYEIIAVDDGSTDNSDEIAQKKGVTVLKLQHQSGPAAARNYGAQRAKGDILFFVDADVIVKKNTIEQVVINFIKNLDIAAVFGSYDDDPAEDNFLSQYKNLSHHFIHQQSNNDAVTFWAGCGAILREIFHELNGFDQKRYSKPSIEDIELGYRMKSNGYRILLDKDLQVKHLKRWRLGSLLRADIFYRAIPWSKLILESKKIINDLNLQTSQKISSGLVGLSGMILLLALFKFKLLYLYIFLFFITIILILNYKYYVFLIKRKGFVFAIFSIPMHLLYYFYSGVTFVLCWSKLNLQNRRMRNSL